MNSKIKMLFCQGFSHSLYYFFFLQANIFWGNNKFCSAHTFSQAICIGHTVPFAIWCQWKKLVSVMKLLFLLPCTRTHIHIHNPHTHTHTRSKHSDSVHAQAHTIVGNLSRMRFFIILVLCAHFFCQRIFGQEEEGAEKKNCYYYVCFAYLCMHGAARTNTPAYKSTLNRHW